MCVEAEALPQAARALASPELAAGAAALRVLLHELEPLAAARQPPDVRERVEAVFEAVHALGWWLTPPNLRIPTAKALDEASVLQVLRHFDEAWGVQSSSTPLSVTYLAWRKRQCNACRVAELDLIDRKYAAWIAREDATERAPSSARSRT